MTGCQERIGKGCYVARWLFNSIQNDLLFQSNRITLKEYYASYVYQPIWLDVI